MSCFTYTALFVLLLTIQSVVHSEPWYLNGPGSSVRRQTSFVWPPGLGGNMWSVNTNSNNNNNAVAAAATNYEVQSSGVNRRHVGGMSATNQQVGSGFGAGFGTGSPNFNVRPSPSGPPPSGQSCSRRNDCKMPGQTLPFEYHPDYDCINGICRRYFMPGEYGCETDLQCTTKCSETRCSDPRSEPHLLNSQGERQCVCKNHLSSPAKGMMYMYADKCWAECPYLTSLDSSGAVPRCVSKLADAPERWVAAIAQAHSRSKRGNAMIMC